MVYTNAVHSSLEVNAFPSKKWLKKSVVAVVIFLLCFMLGSLLIVIKGKILIQRDSL